MPTGIYPRIKQPLAERFWSQVDKSGACWIWMGSVNAQGYGRIKINGKIELTHRVAYELEFGNKIPDGLDVCHKCDNPPCCRPDHLFVGAAIDNMQDSARKGRKHRFGKLAENQIREIRESQGLPQTELARRYEVSNGTISQVLSGKIYSWV